VTSLGLTVASRLAEVDGLTILVIEAGTDEQNNTQVNLPEGYGIRSHNRALFLREFRWQFLLNTRLDWNYTTTPQLIGGKAKTIPGYLSS
jgi:choline dehydrogenase-like flavoprotein